MASKTSISRMRPRNGASKAVGGTSGTHSGGNSRSRVNMSAYASGVTVGQAGNGGGVRVMFEGKNVTPQSLLRPAQSAKGGGNNTTAAAAAAAATAADGVDAERRRSSNKLNDDKLGPSRVGTDSDFKEGGTLGSKSSGIRSKSRKARDGTDDSGFTDEELSAGVSILLSETPTIMLLEIRGSAVATDFRDYDKYQKEKVEYEKRKARQGSDAPLERHTQTVNWPLKNKEVTAAAPLTKDASCSAQAWEIYDEQAAGVDSGVGDDNVYGIDTSNGSSNGKVTATSATSTSSSKKGASTSRNGVSTATGNIDSSMMSKQVLDMVSLALASPGCLLDCDNTTAPPPLWQHASADRDGNSYNNGNGHSSNGYNGSSTHNPHASTSNITGGTHSHSGGSGLVNGKSRPHAASGKNATSARRGSSNNNNNNNSAKSNGSRNGANNASLVMNGSSSNNNSNSVYDDSAGNPVDVAAVLAAARANTVLSSQSLLASLELVERSLFQNTFLSKQLEYHNYPPLEEDSSVNDNDPLHEPDSDSVLNGHRHSSLMSLNLSSSNSNFSRPNSPPVQRAPYDTASVATSTRGGTGGSVPGLEKLWTHVYPFAAGVTGGKTVTSLCFHCVNQDLLAAGYGSLKCVEQKPLQSVTATGATPIKAAVTATVTAGSSSGCVLFWSVRNPGWPERVIRTPSGVTCLDFSARHPSYLAVGMYSGAIAIYDTARSCAQPIAESSTSAGKHTDPVWQVKWTSKGIDGNRGETLVTVSTDGRVVEWSMKKGCTHSPLMLLKRVGATEGVISRQASGLTLDFPVGDSTHYFVGTEDGLIHKCSVSYNEQYLETYSVGGHSGPVYRIKCSPFWDKLFLSCSADWTVKLWDQGSPACLHTLHSVDLFAAVNDACWSPTRSTVLASVTGDGRLELWDLARSTLDPIVRIFVKEPAQTVPENGSGAPNPTGTAPATPAAADYDSDPDDLYESDRKSSKGDAPLPPRVATSGSVHTSSAPGKAGSTVPQKLPPPPSMHGAKSVRGDAPTAVTAVNAGAVGAAAAGGPLNLTSVAFAGSAPVLAVGNAAGSIDVYKIVNLEMGSGVGGAWDIAEQVKKLQAAVSRGARSSSSNGSKTAAGPQ